MVDTFIKEEEPNSTEPNLDDEEYIRSFKEFINNYVDNMLDHEY